MTSSICRRIHRVRDRLISRRTAVINQLRAFLLERGHGFREDSSEAAGCDARHSGERRGRPDTADAEPDRSSLERVEDSSKNRSKDSASSWNGSLPPIRVALASRQIPGIGPIVATAIVAAIGNGAAFRKGRDFAAWLGIVPRQYSTGGKAKLLGISKRGNVYLRKILIHGARAAVLRIKRDRAPIGAWLDALDARAPKNVVVVAMANKLARIAWAVLSSGEDYRPMGNVLPHEIVRKRRLRLGSADALPLYRTTDDGLNLPTEVCTGTARTKEQSQRRV